MTSLEYVTLGAVTENFDKFRKPVKTPDRKPGPYPYYGASGIIDSVEAFTHEGTYLLVAEDGENLRTRNTPIAFLAHERFWANNHVHVIRGNDRSDTRFLTALLSMTDVSGYLTGSTLPKLTRSALDSIVLALPSLPEQQLIADLVGTLDDKIGANRRAVANIERICKALVSTISARAELDTIVESPRKLLTPAEFGDREVWHYSLPSFDDGALPKSEMADSIKSAKYMLDGPSVLVSKLNPRFPRVWDVPHLPPGRALSSTEFVVLTTSVCTSSVLWAVLAQTSFGSALETKAAGTSGSHQRVRPADLLATRVIDPRAIPTLIAEQVTSMGRLAVRLRQESVELARMRDFLLPQLISGKLRVRDAEQQVEELV